MAPAAPKIRLAILSGPRAGEAFEFAVHATLVAGRSKTCGLSLPGDEKLSRHHCIFEFASPRCRLKDLDSANGTLVNGQRVDEVELRAGDRVTVGQTELEVQVVGTPGTDTAVLDERPPVRCVRCQKLAEDAFATSDDGGSGHKICAACRDALAAVPEVVPGHKLLRKVGEGGMGAVYLATNLKTNELVAVKTLRPQSAGDPKALQMFLREATTGAQLDHPNAIRVHGSGYVQGLFYFLMDYVDGPDLESWLAQLGRALTLAEATPIMGQLLDVLEHAHSRKLVHRDVKPSNILLAAAPPAPIVKLADFGLMRRFQAAGYSFITRTGEGRGTPRYMPPEQIDDARNAGPAADLYSLASTFFFMLALETPLLFDGRRNPILVVMESKPRRLRELAPAVPAAVDEVLARCLAKEPGDRFQSASAFKAALGEAIRRGR